MFGYPLLWRSSSGTYRGQFTWEASLPPFVLGILTLILIVALIWQWRTLRQRVTLRCCLGLSLLRAFVYAFLLLMLSNPSFLLQKVREILPKLSIVVDTSGSMGLPATGDQNRWQQITKYLLGEAEHSPLQELANHYQLTVYQFDETARSLAAEKLQEVQVGGRTTDVVGSLASVLEQQRTTLPVGIVVLSDGAHHGADTGLGYLRQTGVPIVTIGAGNPATYRDIRIARIQAPTLSFLHYPVEVKVTLQAWGYAGETVSVALQREGRVAATRTVFLQQPFTEEEVIFEIEPEEVGEFTYSVGVAPYLGEALTENNQANFSLSVVRDKIRVLLVCGSPTWNYRFLRQGFKQDPSIDLISFVILRTPTDVVNVPENQLSLIPFPTRRLFTQELKNFDVIVFENFSYQRYFPWYYLENVRSYVQEGGAFAMIGGGLAFAQGGYSATPIEEILPVALRNESNDYRAVTQRMVLTEEGKGHPITRLVPDAEENQRLWENMPELDALNIVARAKPGATVLGVSSGQFENKSVPLLAMQRFGTGRTLALMSDYIWKWNFQMAGQMDSNQYYLQFVRQMVRWLIRDPVLQQVRLSADANEFPIGSEVTGTLQVLQDDYRPAPHPTLTPRLRTPSGAEGAVHYSPTGNPGEFRYRFQADEEGFYELDMQAQVDTTTHDANRVLIRTYRPGEEMQSAAPNHELLQQIAERSGGHFFTLDDPKRPSLVSLAQFFSGNPDYRVLEETRLRLRESWPLFLVLLVLLAGEWWWRRRAGLL